MIAAQYHAKVVIVRRLSNGRAAAIRIFGDGRRKRFPAVSAHARSRQTRGPVRRTLPDNRLRAVEPSQLGGPIGLRADAVQVAVARRPRTADVGRAQLL